MWHEIEAKIADRRYPTLPPELHGIDPHHLTTARHTLSTAGEVAEVREKTRGGSSVSVLVPTNQRHRKTLIAKASARKRLLQARYLGWTRASGREPNVIAIAGERVTHASLRAATERGTGYYLVRPGGGEVTTLLDEAVPGGPLDDAALLVFPQQAQVVTATILIEVKNLRHWIYPSSAELFQLLDKAARLQIARPDVSFVPVLVCRRAHYTTFTMAKDLGLIVLETKVQPILPHSTVPAEDLAEVNAELGYELVRTEQPLDLLTSGFQTTIPRNASTFAQQWSRTAPNLSNSYRILRSASLTPAQRKVELDKLRDTALQLLNVHGKW